MIFGLNGESRHSITFMEWSLVHFTVYLLTIEVFCFATTRGYENEGTFKRKREKLSSKIVERLWY